MFNGVFTDLWYVVVPPFSLLLLQFDGDSSDWTPLDPFHQMRHIPVAKSFNITFMNRHILEFTFPRLQKNWAKEKPKYLLNIWNVNCGVWEHQGLGGSVSPSDTGKAHRFAFPALSMTWLQASHDHFRYRIGENPDLIDSPGDLVTELLAWDDGDLLAHPLVCVEVAAQPGVVFLDDDPSGLLHRLGPDSSLLWAYYEVKHVFYIILH